MKSDENNKEILVHEISILRNRIDELEKLYEAQRKDSEFKGAVLDSLNEFITAWDYQGFFLYGNKTFFDRSGFSLDIIGKPVIDLYPPQEIAKMSLLYSELADKPDGTSVAVSSHGLSGTGEWVAWSGEFTKRLEPPICGYVGNSREATDSETNKEAYKESVEAMSTILNAVQDALLIHDKSGIITHFNEKTLELFGMDRADAVLNPKAADYFYSPEDGSIDLKSAWKDVLDGKKKLLEFRIRRPSDGKPFDVEIFMRSIRLKGEDQILVAIKDVTDKKRVTDELHRALGLAEKLRMRAEAASETKSKFLANMSHELRTPLNAILGFSELLEGKFYGEINEKQAAYVKAIYNSGEHLLQLINDILDLAKVEAGKMEMTPCAVDLGQLLENSFTMIKETAYKRGIILELDVAEEFYNHEIWTDGIRVKQIIMNLLSNATKFTPSRGTIRLEAEVKNKEIRISVSDNGIGIKPEDQARIFEEFVQVDSSFSRHQQGTGLGLSLTRKLVELIGGRIWVESEGEHKGSVFTFQIPYVLVGVSQTKDDFEDRIPGVKKSESNIDGHPTDNLRRLILVVEDNTVNMKLTTNLLEVGGYKSLQAFSSEEAVIMLQTQVPDLILMDISLPGMDGLTATQVIKNNPLTSDIPIVALTAHAMKDDEAKAKEAGCEAYLLKPIDTTKFYRTISQILDSRNSESKL